MNAISEEIHNELVCGCVEESGYEFVKGTTHLACWYAHLAAKIVDSRLPELLKEAWDEAAEATSEWMWNNPSPSGIHHDPPRNPYEV